MRPISETHSSSTKQRLRKSVEVLRLIENCRRTTGDKGVGLAIERLIVERELSELEGTARQDDTARVATMDRDVVIPVRRVVDPWMT